MQHGTVLTEGRYASRNGDNVAISSPGYAVLLASERTETVRRPQYYLCSFNRIRTERYLCRSGYPDKNCPTRLLPSLPRQRAFDVHCVSVEYVLLNSKVTSAAISVQTLTADGGAFTVGRAATAEGRRCRGSMLRRCLVARWRLCLRRHRRPCLRI